MTMPSYMYQNPANHAKFSRERDCKGCKHLEHVFDIKMCKIKPMVRGDNLKKCSKYREEE